MLFKIFRAEQKDIKKEESSPELDKYMEVWENISRDLDDIIKKSNVDTRNIEATRLNIEIINIQYMTFLGPNQFQSMEEKQPK